MTCHQIKTELDIEYKKLPNHIPYSPKPRHTQIEKTTTTYFDGFTGDCYDNAMIESFFSTIKRELINRRTFQTRTQAMREIFRYIEGWYNPRRRHSSIDYLSPMEYENLYLTTTKHSNSQVSTKPG